MQRLLPLVLCALLAACGQQAQPEAAADRAPAAGPAAPGADTSGQATSATQQVGLSPAINPPPDTGSNPTGRGELGGAGRGQGPAPGQAGHPDHPVADRSAQITPEEAAADCDRLDAPHRQQCLDKIQHGVKLEAKRDD